MGKHSHWALFAGIFIISLSVLALETVLNRMFALTFWYHFAFIILSVALFGIGLGGLLVFFTNRFVKKFLPLFLAIISALLAFSIPWVLLHINSIPLQMNDIATDPVQQGYFRDFFLTLIIPFVLAGYIFSSLFSNLSEKINQLYFFDLLGGGIGCFFALAVFPHHGPMFTAYIISIAVIVGAAFFAFRQNAFIAIPVLLLIIPDILFVYPLVKDVEVRVDKEKRNVEIFGKKLFSDWDNFGYVAVFESANGSRVATADFTCFTYMYNAQYTKDFSEFKKILKSHYYPYVVKKDPDDVGVIGVGEGKDIQLALGCGAGNVYGAEFNSTIYRTLKEVYTNFTGNIANLPNVHVEFQEGRFFIRSTARKYDVLVFDNSISQVAVSSGSFTLAESYLFTVEAMIDYLNKLKPGGVIYLSNPIPHAERFACLLKEAFHRLGRDNEFKHSIIMGDEENSNYRKCKLLVKNGVFSPEEVQNVVKYMTLAGHKVLYAPGLKTGSIVEDLILAKNMDNKYFLSDQELRPSTDNWPFFSQHMKPDSVEFTRDIYAIKHYYPQPFLMLRQITSQVALYSVIFMLLPLLFLNLGGLRKLPNKAGSILYFASLGLGFMMMEVVLMQKYTLILGHPVYSFSVVLSALLISTGIGSFLSERIKNPYRAIFIGLCGIITTTILSYLITQYLDSFLIGFIFVWRVIIVALLVSLTGVFMGLMMPSGIRVISSVQSSIPWMWSINGIFSVVASFIAVFIAILYGFTAVFIIGLAVYTVGTLFFTFRLVLKE